jgi:hypothetical protein
MKKSKKSNSIPRLNKARERFDRWRSERRHQRERIPEKLWRQAAELAKTYGINRTARTLGLQYDKLKERAEAGAALSAAKFVEMAPGMGAFMGGSVIEVERPSGAKLRIELRGESLDIDMLMRSFLEGRV